MPSTKEFMGYVADTKSEKKQFTVKEAKQIGDSLGIPWDKIDIEKFATSLNNEFDSARENPDVMHDSSR